MGEHHQLLEQHAYPNWGSSFNYLWADIYILVSLTPINTNPLWIIKSYRADSEIKFLIKAVLKLHNISCYTRSILYTVSCAQTRYYFSLCKVMFFCVLFGMLSLLALGTACPFLINSCSALVVFSCSSSAFYNKRLCVCVCVCIRARAHAWLC